MSRLALVTATLVAALASSPSLAALALAQNDGATPTAFANGGGGGFGGTLGLGSISLDVNGANLDLAFDPGANLNDLAVILLDTRAGGFTDAQMNDTGDGGRRAVSNLAGNADDAFPILPDFGVAFGDFGVVAFELTAGSTPNHLAFLAFSDAQTGNDPTLIRRLSLPLATLGVTSTGNIDFFMGYVAGSGFGSNESLPASAGLNAADNVGDGTASAGYENFNRLVVPEPTTLAALAGVAAVATRRRK